MIQLPPTEFTFGKYGTDIPFTISMSDNLLVKWYLKQDIIGYCDSMSVKIRPRIGCMAIMINIDDWQSWCHIPKEVFKRLIGELT